MPFFRKKPVIIEARQFNSTYLDDQQALADWCHGRLRGAMLTPDLRVIQIDTLEGEMTASFEDWIICGVNGEYYPCKPDIFEKTYEKCPERKNVQKVVYFSEESE